MKILCKIYKITLGIYRSIYLNMDYVRRKDKEFGTILDNLGKEKKRKKKKMTKVLVDTSNPRLRTRDFFSRNETFV